LAELKSLPQEAETAEYELEIEIRSPNPPETRADMKILKAGEKWETSFTAFGIEGSNSAKLEASALPSVNLEKRLDYLLNYPHGCSEQITSAAFPQLWLKDLADNDKTIAHESAENIKAAINSLASRQMANGGIALWPGSYQPDNWVTSYAGHFIIEAEKLGYNVPSGFKQKWISYQRRTAQEWRFDTKYKYTANDQAYRLFTLALAGQPEKGAMNRLREAPGIPRLSNWLLAASFATSGRAEVAGELLDVRTTETEQDYWYYYYGSPIRDKSIILYTLTLLKNVDQALPLLKEVCDDLSSDSWYSTQSLAWALFSYMKWVEITPSDSKSAIKFTTTINGDKSDVSISSKQLSTKDISLAGGSNTVVIENRSENPVYVNLVRKGIPLVSDIPQAEKGLSMKVSYLNMQMKPIDQKDLVQGTDFMMIVKVASNLFSRVENIALTTMVPSGWEIQNTRLFEAQFGIKESSFDYRDFRDDRINTYFGLGQGETKTFTFVLNAAYKGIFYQPSLRAEAMYTENCYAGILGTKVAVRGE